MTPASLAFAIKLMCPSVEVVNYTDVWTKVDQANLQRAIYRCEEIYTRSPCLKVFTKKEFQTYTALCGRP